MRFDRGTRALDQFDKNATNAQVQIGAEEAVTQQRQVATDQLNRLLDDAISLGNTKIGNEYKVPDERPTERTGSAGSPEWIGLRETWVLS